MTAISVLGPASDTSEYGRMTKTVKGRQSERTGICNPSLNCSNQSSHNPGCFFHHSLQQIIEERGCGTNKQRPRLRTLFVFFNGFFPNTIIFLIMNFESRYLEDGQVSSF